MKKQYYVQLARYKKVNAVIVNVNDNDNNNNNNNNNNNKK